LCVISSAAAPAAGLARVGVAELGDEAAQRRRSAAVGEDDLVAGAHGMARERLTDRSGSEDPEGHGCAPCFRG
jgi:hypothetical protein